VPANTTVETLNAGEEGGEANGERTDQHNNDDDKGEEEGGNCKDARGWTISTFVVARVSHRRSCSHTNSSDGLPQLLLSPSLSLSAYLQLLLLAVDVNPLPPPLPPPVVVVVIVRSLTPCGDKCVCV
jgi:hypothetical protein